MKAFAVELGMTPSSGGRIYITNNNEDEAEDFYNLHPMEVLFL